VEEINEWYYQKLFDKVEKIDRPLLKALIKMKCREFDFSLLELYELDETMFEEKTLLRDLNKT